jgi:hypothetical protein
MTPEQQTAVDRLNAYASLMEEVKYRHAAIQQVLDGRTGLPHLVAHELGYLQLRYTCELIALGCLVAHGDIPAVQSKRLRKAWAADEIINTLDRLHPDFFPHAVKQVALPPDQVPDGSTNAYDLPRLSDGFLTKDELIALYHECGTVLHRGSLDKLHLRPQRHADTQKLREYLARIVALLNHHTIQPVDPQYLYIIMMKTDSTGNVQANLFGKIS